MAKKKTRVVRKSRKPVLDLRVGDCVQVMNTLFSDGFLANLIFADPPFNIGRRYGNVGDAMSATLYDRWTSIWMKAAYDLLHPKGTMWINIPDEHVVLVDTLARGLGLHRRKWCIWHYRFGQNTRGNFISSKVHAMYYVRDPKVFTWRPDAVLVPSDRASKYGDKRTLSKKDGGQPGMRCPFDVWHGDGFSRVTGNSRERVPEADNQLPEAYLTRVVLSTSRPGDMVLDPFFGSGTTGVVALRHSRWVTGIEHDETRARAARKRCEEVSK